MRRIAATTVMLVLLSGLPALAGGRGDGDEILDHIERILRDVERAQDILNDRPPRHHEHLRAQAELRRREAELEHARVDAMSAATGVPRGRIVSLRAHGRTWYGIAADLGVSPRVVGLPAPLHAGRHEWQGWGDDHGHGGYSRGPRNGSHIGPQKGPHIVPQKGPHKEWKHLPPGQAKKRHGRDA